MTSTTTPPEPPDEYQAARYDYKAHRLVAQCVDNALPLADDADPDEDTILLRAADWEALVQHLQRTLLPGDLVRYAQEQPGTVLNRAMKLMEDADWMKRARAESAARKGGG